MKIRQHLLIVAALAAALSGGPGATEVQASSPIEPLAAQPLLPSVDHPWDGRDWLARFYAPRGYAPAWTPGQAQAALAVLDRAAEEGLDPADYHSAQLRAQAGAATDPAHFDVMLTAEMLHYLADLRLGRVRTGYYDSDSREPVRPFDPVAILTDALASGGVDDALPARAEPPFASYARLKELLARYRILAAQPQPALPAPGGQLRAGARYPGALNLHARLVELGDLDAGTPAPPKGVYDAALAAGVKQFQQRHGLADRGVLDQDTVDALNVPLAERVRALELAMERLRALPDFTADSMVLVDLPVYRLWAVDRADPGDPPLEMKVIVGNAMKTPTPLFIGQMRYLEFNPYWNVPHSIVKNEIIPRLERGGGYLAHEQMEVVGAGAPTSRVDASTIELLREGALRVRQRPGPKNSLGAVKFAMPNPMDIYLHATPQRELFRRTRRDLSHGCIRVEKPAELVRFVLRGQAQWTADAVEDAMRPGPTHRVDLPAPVPVVIFYATAMADRDGHAVFARDVYQLDDTLAQALREHSVRVRAANVAAAPAPTG